MENSTRLLWRQEESLAGRRVLVVDANDPELADLPAEQVYLHADDYTVGAHQWAPLPTLPEDTDLVILPLPKSSERLELLLRGLAGSVEEPLEVWLVGPAKGGIRGGVIDPTGAQRPSEDREEDMVVRHAESPASTRPAVGIRGGKRPHLGADRVAGPDRVRQVDTLEGHGTGLREPPGQSVGSARYGVLLGDHDGHTPQHRSDHTRNRRVSAEADHDGRSKTAYQSDTGDDGGE